MLVNILRFRFKTSITEEQRARALHVISKTAALPSVSFSVVGQDLGDPEDGYTHAYLSGIKDLIALDAYLSHPVHREGDFVFLPLVEKLTRSAMSDDYDPELAKNIGELYSGKMAKDPEWLNLIQAAFGGNP